MSFVTPLFHSEGFFFPGSFCKYVCVSVHPFMFMLDFFSFLSKAGPLSVKGDTDLPSDRQKGKQAPGSLVGATQD